MGKKSSTVLIKIILIELEITEIFSVYFGKTSNNKNPKSISLADGKKLTLCGFLH